TVDTGGSFEDLLDVVRDDDIDAFDRAEVPFDLLVDRLVHDRSEAFAPLAQVMLAMNHAESVTVTAAPDGLTVEPLAVGVSSARHDLGITVTVTDVGDWELEIVHDAGLFEHTTIRRWTRMLVTILDTVTATPHVPVGDIELLDAEEAAQVRRLADGGAAVSPLGSTLTEVLRGLPAGDPTATAVVAHGADGGQESITYADLAARTARLAADLVALGVGPDTPVGVAVARSIEMIVAVHAVVVAGGQYVPLDLDAPVHRSAEMLRTAGAPVVVVSRDAPWVGTEDVRGEVAVVAVGDERRTDPVAPPVPPVRPDHAAYTIFTSGSTGAPKGVTVSHRAILARLAWGQRDQPLGPDDVVLQKTPITFDVSVPELFSPFLVGATVVLAEPGLHGDPFHIRDLVAAHGVTSVHFVPSLLSLFCDVLAGDPRTREMLSTLRRVSTTGEALSVADARAARALMPGAPLWNLYGPTEAAVEITAHRVDADAATVPIGRPLPQSVTHVLDERLRPVPLGVVGGLYLGGPQLARGYAARTGLTSERFVADPRGEPGARLYRTGDLVRWNADGDLEYLGRRDSQVKLRGHRIELGEVEVAMSTAAGVMQAAVTIVEAPGGDLLVGYHTGSAESDSVAEHVAGILPAHLRPTRWVHLETMPHSVAGKIDRKALPAPSVDAVPAPDAPPVDPVAAGIARIVEDVLGVTPDATTDFFALGGTSLSAVRVAGRVGEAFGVDLGVREFLAAPTVLGLVDTVRAARRASHPLRPRDPDAVVPLGLAQRRIWFLNQLDPSSTTYLMPVALDVDGPLDRVAMHDAVGDVIARHTALRTVFPTGDDGTPRQQVLDVGDALARPWWQEAPSVEAAMALCGRGFDVTRDMPIRAALAGDGGRHRLVVVLHHIAGDAASGDILARDLTDAYRRRVAGDRLPELALGHADHTLWEQAVLGDVDDPASVLGEQSAWWRDRLADLPARTDIPTDRPRRRVEDSTGGRVELTLGRERSAALLALGRRRGLTTFMTLHAALSVTVFAFTGCDDVVIGAPVSGRRHPATADMVGMFVNTVVLRTSVRPDDAVDDLLARVRDDDTSAFSHADLPFDLLVELLAPDRADRRPPIHQITLNLVEEADADDALADLGLTVHGVELGPEPAKVDIAVGVTETADGLRGSITYAAALYDASTVERFRDVFLRVVDALVAGVAPVDAVLGGEPVTVGPHDPVVLDRRLRPLPAGLVGDLWLRGSAVPTLLPGAAAATRVVADPAGPAGARMYRTGDLARMRDGGVEVIGAQPSAAARPPSRSDAEIVEPAVGVLGETERWIATVFADVVGASAMAVTDNFFDVGGTSLSAARAVARLRRQGVAVELPWVFSDPTPRALAARVASGAGGGRVLLTLRGEGSGPPLFCVHPAGGLAWMYGGLAPFLPDRPVHALQDPAVVAAEPAPESIEDYAQRYVAEIRAVQPHGPYHLLGWSLGGHIAHAMAEQLEAAEEEVAVLGLLDT
ncbi:MAG: amino acid adenylation domain-containing protein, partial [Williamsia herbipolensis]|nr:amino acid adenylation domain-containing protein [Williamsia herbipolensis]